MRQIIASLFLVISFSIFLSPRVQAQVDINKLYDKNWRAKTYDIIKPNSSVPIYYRYENKGALNYGSATSIFKRDGTIEGFNAGGWPLPGSFKLLANNQMLIDGDERPSQITKLTDTEFSVEMTQPYTTILTNETYNITTKITYESFDPCAVYESLRSGDWNDPTLWTCQQIPTINNKVQVNQNHRIVVPDNYTAYAKTIIQNGKVDLKQNAKLILGN